MGPTRGQTQRLRTKRWIEVSTRAALLRRIGRLTASGAMLHTLPAHAEGVLASVSSALPTLLVLGGCALGLAGGLFALAEHAAAKRVRRALRATTAKARILLASRDAWLSGGHESLMVWAQDMNTPLSFGEGAQLMEACLTGPDATILSAALDALASAGQEFSLAARNADGQMISVRGRPAGGSAVVYLAPQLPDTGRGAGPDFRAALDALPLPVWLRRAPDLGLTFVNRAFLAQAGATAPEAALAANVAFDRSERDLASAAIGDAETVEAKRFAVISGRRRALQFTLSPLPEGGVVGSALDVTALAEAQAKLQLHIDAHAETLDKLATAVAIFGSDKKLSFYNRAYVKLWGLPDAWLDAHPSKSEILDRLRELRRLPEQQPDFRAWKLDRLKQFEQPDEQPEELWHLPGGQTLRVVIQPHPFGGLVYLYEDVSDKLRLESSYNTLIKVQKATLDTLQEGVAVFGPDGRLKLYNTAFAGMWHLDAAELAGEPHLKRIADACAVRFGRDRAWEIVTSTVTAAAPERRREWGEVERSDGAVILVSISPLPDGATMVSFVDSTDRFRIESALRERNEALEESDKLKTEFVKRVSYELRTPLNPILGFAELLKAETAGPLNVKQAEYVNAMVKASNELRRLINDVLDLSDIETGSITLDLRSLDLYALLKAQVDLMDEWAERLGLTLKLDCDDGSGSFLGDPKRINQVIFNLLSNAFKYTPRGGTVTLGGAIADGAVSIFVADTGSGVSPEVMPSAFERFSAKGSALTRGGAGLGLALVNRFIELHHGWVELESLPGKGTKVTCHLPRDAVQELKAPEIEEQLPA